jgi:shikimate dehydrogenase
MLLHQAVRQIRIFLHGDPSAELADEIAVVAAMRAALQA